MLSKCANPRCITPFRYLHEGKLFRIEMPSLASRTSSPGVNMKKPPRRTEFFWLCDTCSAQMTVVYEKDLGVTTHPLPALRAGFGL